MPNYEDTKRIVHCPNCGVDFYCYEFPADEGGELFLYSEDDEQGNESTTEIGFWYCACPDCDYFIKIAPYKWLK